MVEIGTTEVEIYMKDFSSIVIFSKPALTIFFITYQVSWLLVVNMVNFNPIEIKEVGVIYKCRKINILIVNILYTE